ncbi:hypothetical protein Rhopal_002296-T1 [Rhodotorula paludigena]|uniref:Uncharacterized protein n=1 Tax=Rhodotorula paludigena TaxID=86838 RepID=A0AAV5GA99_9BASI|nr:hypothetical protein Rhopal_002296-T1 [Rhodotorula paludigena]
MGSVRFHPPPTSGSSTAVSSASFPATPAQPAAGSVVYRSAGSSTALPLLTSRKGKEREQDAWQAGAPMLSPPVRPLALPATTSPPVGLGLDETHESYVANLASLPNLRAVAEGDKRRPSIPYAFEPRPPRTRSPGAERRSKDSLRRGATPIIFPSRPVGSISQHRHNPSAPPAVSAHKPPIPPRTKRNVVAAGAYEALTSRRPRFIVVDASPTSSPRGSFDASERDLSLLPTTARRRVKGKRPAREGYLTEADIEELLDDDAEHSSVRRVLRETERERAERAAWSDSAMRGIGFGLSLRLAGREMEQGRKSLAIEQRRAEKKALRKEVARRKRAEAAAANGGESEAELDNHGGRRRNRHFPAPDYSPPMPQSFDPFAQLGRKLSLSRSRERRRRAGEAGAASDGVGLGIVDAFWRKRSASHSRQASAVGAASAEPTTPRTVRGQPIRHLRLSGSVDSLNSRMHSSAPVLPPLPSLQIDETFTSVEGNVTTHFGEALTAPVDLPLQPVGEMRRPSVTAQNAFLSLPPHLHHLLRSPADPVLNCRLDHVGSAAELRARRAPA